MSFFLKNECSKQQWQYLDGYWIKFRVLIGYIRFGGGKRNHCVPNSFSYWESHDEGSVRVYPAFENNDKYRICQTYPNGK